VEAPLLVRAHVRRPQFTFLADLFARANKKSVDFLAMNVVRIDQRALTLKIKS
jgi:hypothetical protein